MNSNRRPKKSALVRFFRGVFRLIKVLFAPKRKNIKSAEDYQHELRSAELDRRQRQAQEQASNIVIEQPQEQLLTVGEMFGQVKWKDSSSTALGAKPLEMGMTARSRDAALN